MKQVHNNSFDGKIENLPLALTESQKKFENIHLGSSYGVGISGVGGGEYLTVIAEAKIENAIRPKIRTLYYGQHIENMILVVMETFYLQELLGRTSKCR